MKKKNTCINKNPAEAADIDELIHHMAPWDSSRVAVEICMQISQHSEALIKLVEQLKSLYL